MRCSPLQLMTRVALLACMLATLILSVGALDRTGSIEQRRVARQDAIELMQRQADRQHTLSSAAAARIATARSCPAESHGRLGAC